MDYFPLATILGHGRTEMRTQAFWLQRQCFFYSVSSFGGKLAHEFAPKGCVK